MKVLEGENNKWYDCKEIMCDCDVKLVGFAELWFM